MLEYTSDPAVHNSQYCVLHWIAIGKSVHGRPASAVFVENGLASILCFGVEPGGGRLEDLPSASRLKVLIIQPIYLVPLQLAIGTEIVRRVTGAPERLLERQEIANRSKYRNSVEVSMGAGVGWYHLPNPHFQKLIYARVQERAHCLDCRLFGRRRYSNEECHFREMPHLVWKIKRNRNDGSARCRLASDFIQEGIEPIDVPAEDEIVGLGGEGSQTLSSWAIPNGPHPVWIPLVKMGLAKKLLHSRPR
jgi:hypothetical protein